MGTIEMSDSPVEAKMVKSYDWTHFDIMLPETATDNVYLRPEVGLKIAVGFDVSTLSLSS